MPREAQPALSDARIMDLEDAVHESISTIEFLHGCLTNPVFEYAYPEQTAQVLERLRALAPPLPMCVHSRMTRDCPACAARLDRYERRAALEPSA
jgi:hypothetical protein